ncbi:MAG: efflux RND transporter permease subunit [Magnetococcales bacterium]|nr:efflux RND transporter permease subunit [Magnetococcales bacterium]
MSSFFIDRPVFAWVIAIVIMLAGSLAILQLPVEQYPNIAPPSVSISASYPGASAETLENSVTQVIEQSLTGIDHMRYFSSSSDSSGLATITVTFEPEANPDIAQVQVQNKLQTAMPLLPPEVQQQGVSVTKANNSFLLVAGFYSKDGSISQQELGDLLNSTVKDAVARVNGVGNVTIFGEPHAMRIWLNPRKLLSYNLTVMDVQQAIRAQNSDISAGQIGGLPAQKGQQLNATISAQSRLQTVEDFQHILLRVNTDGSQVRLQDIARVELGSQNYGRVVRYKRLPAAGVAVSLASGANALDTAAAVKKRISELSSALPPEVTINYPYDTTPFVKLSIKEVIKTLLEAVFLVFLVMYLFLQNFRATLIPTIAVPVVLMGTFGVLASFGFSINVLTMFAMVLAIGLLVDDAIVVVENVERIMAQEGLSPREATRKSMRQITGALVGIALVLSAVFVPMAFFSGSAGAIYRQFSITIVSAMALSVLVALVLSPSLCATLLKPVEETEQSRGFFAWFNRFFNTSRDRFITTSGYMAARIGRFLLVYGLLLGGLGYLFLSLPSSFLPNEDQGTMYLMASAPAGSTVERTMESVELIEDYFLNHESDTINHLFTVTGFSFAGRAQNVALGFVGLKDWEERTDKDQSVFALAGRAMGAFSAFKDARAFAFYPPPIRELGNAAGFDLQLVDQGGIGHEKLMQARNQLLGMAAKNTNLQGVRPNGLNDVPQYKIDIDHEKASALGLSIADINQTLQTAWGSSYVNDFLDKSRIKRVYLQADAPYRMMPDDVNSWYVRNKSGEMVPFSAFSTARWSYGAPKLERFNGNGSVNIQGSAAPGVSTGTAMEEIERMVESLPKGVAVEWIGLSYEEQRAGAQALILYGVSALFIFLCLAALYESWSVPFSVILSVPLGILGAVIAARWFNLSNDVYFQVGLLTTMGLASKNAILIVEFAKEQYQQGMDLRTATLSAAKQRFRPIIMTSMAFILGVSPLALAHGAGSASQNAIGISVMGGMIAATFIAIFFIPMLYIGIQGRSAPPTSVASTEETAS